MMRYKRYCVLCLLYLLSILIACTGDPQPVVEVEDSNPVRGRTLMSQYGCESCHRIPSVPGADSDTAPSLEHFARRAYIAGNLPNTPENLIAWLRNPQDIEPNTVMPNMGISEKDARDMTAYLLSLD